MNKLCQGCRIARDDFNDINAVCNHEKKAPMNANHFTEALLPLHIKLQGLYREKMLLMQEGDEFVTDCNPFVYTVDRMENSECRWLVVAKAPYKNLGYDYFQIKECIRIPRTIDDSSPEASRRSLIEMCNNFISLTKGSLGWVCTVYDETGVDREYLYQGATSTECILKALLHQEGIEP